MRNLIDKLLFVVIGIPLFILTFPFKIMLFLIAKFQRKRFEKKYAQFLIKNNGTNFFCYTNRKNTNSYMEENILPNLPEGIEIVYIDGKQMATDYDTEFIFEALNKLKYYSRFPRMMKIRNGRLIDQSLNHPFYNIMNFNKRKNKFLLRIEIFFA